jgi:hypothetical protein
LLVTLSALGYDFDTVGRRRADSEVAARPDAADEPAEGVDEPR